MEKLGVVIVAAGKGSRMKAAISKQYLMLQNRPIIVHTLLAFQSFQEVNEIVLVVGIEDIAMVENWIEQYGASKVKCVIAGGSERQSSVYKGLQQLSDDIQWVAVHDGVRPFVTREALDVLLKQTKQSRAAVLAVPVKDTIKVVSDDGIIESTPDRAKLWAIQTPQGFERAIIMQAHQAAEADNFLGTDDATLVERIGIPVHVVQGDYDNIKITTPDDLPRAEAILASKI